MDKNEEAYQLKQQWIEAVMADPSLTNAMKVYAFGIFSHMYGKKDDAWPGKEAIHETTSLGTGHYSEYAIALEARGHLEVNRRPGTSNMYTLVLGGTPNGGNTYPEPVEHLPRAGGTVPPIGGPNTTKKTTKKTSSETYKDAPVVADAPTVTSEPSLTSEVKDDQYVYMGTLKDEDFKPFPNLSGTLAFDYLANADGVQSLMVAPKEQPEVPPTGGTKDEPVSEEEYEKGEKYLERLIAKNNIVGEARSKARRLYHDEDYMSGTHGMMRAGWVIGHLNEAVRG